MHDQLEPLRGSPKEPPGTSPSGSAPSLGKGATKSGYQTPVPAEPSIDPQVVRLEAFRRFVRSMDDWRKANPTARPIDDRRESFYDDSRE